MEYVPQEIQPGTLDGTSQNSGLMEGAQMGKEYVISYDIGTSGVKVLFFSLEGKILGNMTEHYPLYSDENNFAEQDHELFWAACCKATHHILASNNIPVDHCVGIAFGTQWKTIIPIDASGHVLRRGIIWMDKRAGKQAQQLNRSFQQNLFCESDYWPKLLWFKENEPELYNKSAYILETGAYLKWKATGEFVSDITNSYMRSNQPSTQQFYNEILRYTGLDEGKFPETCEATDNIGQLTSQAAEALGLCVGIPVFGGCCDISALAIGSGCCARGDAHLYLGTSGWIGHIAPHDGKAVYFCPLDQEDDVSFYGLGASVGSSTGWAIQQLYPNEKREFGDDIWDFLAEELKGIKPGAGRLLAAPWFFGARPPFASGKARAVFLNLNSTHTRAHMLAAILEGFCYIVRQNLSLLNSRIDQPLKSITVCGGGAKDKFWMKAMANILKIPVRVVSDPENTGAIGVAYCALIGLEKRADFHAVKNHIKIDTIYEPDPASFAEYDLLYSQFEKIHPILTELFHAMNS